MTNKQKIRVKGSGRANIKPEDFKAGQSVGSTEPKRGGSGGPIGGPSFGARRQEDKEWVK